MSITFKLNMGPGIDVTAGTLKFYCLSGTAPELMRDVTVKNIGNNTFQQDIARYSGYTFYAVFAVTEYRYGGQQQVSGENIQLISVVKGDSNIVEIGSQSTIAAAYCFAQMITLFPDNDRIDIRCPDNNLPIPYGMKNNFIADDGTISGNISQSPNGKETNSYPMFNFLSALYSYALVDSDVYQQFAGFTRVPGKQTGSFFGSLMQLVRNPHNPNDIYGLISQKPELFTPSLTSLTLPAGKTAIPDQWTLTYKATDSGATNFLAAGAAYVVFDKDNKAWITNNFRAGSAFSGTHILVMNPDGSAADISPVTGGGLLGTAFGAAVNPAGDEISIGNFGWGPELFNPQYGSISRFSSDGKVISPGNGFVNGLSRVQGMCYDKAGNLWMASVGTQTPFAPAPDGVYPFTGLNSAVVVYIGGDPENWVSFDNFLGDPSPDHSTFDVCIDNDGNAIVSNIGTKGVQPSSVHKVQLAGRELVLLSSWVSTYTGHSGVEGFEEFRQVAVNKNNDVFLVAINSSRMYKLDMSGTEGKVICTYEKNISAPWGVIIDTEGTIFVSNFGRDKDEAGETASDDSLDRKGPFGVTVIRNEDESTAQLWTVPTAGDPVTLRNGQGLYGTYTRETTDSDGNPVTVTYQPKCYQPIMRLTASGIDRAGNLWAMNNWKPSIIDDVFDNPGGDGAVIFLGVAAPLP